MRGLMTERAGIRCAIIRDSLGKIVAAMATKIRNPGTVLGSELTAILYGLNFCSRNDFANVWIFSDTLEAVRAVNFIKEYYGHE